MDPNLVRTLSLTAAAVSLVLHYVAGRGLSRRLGEHLAMTHEDGWRRAGGARLGGRSAGAGDVETFSRVAAWRWVRTQARLGTECERCRGLARSGTLLIASVASTTFLLLAIAEIWGR